MTETIDFQQRTVVIVMKQGDIENSTVIIHRQNYDCHSEDNIDQGGIDDEQNSFDQNSVTYPSDDVEEYLPEGETEQYEAESEPEYEKEEDYVMGYLSWYIIRIMVILCYILFRYVSQA